MTDSPRTRQASASALPKIGFSGPTGNRAPNIRQSARPDVGLRPYRGENLARPSLIGNSSPYKAHEVAERYKTIQKSYSSLFGIRLDGAAALSMAMAADLNTEAVNDSFWPSHASMSRYAPEIPATRPDFEERFGGESLEDRALMGAGEYPQFYPEGLTADLVSRRLFLSKAGREALERVNIKVADPGKESSAPAYYDLTKGNENNIFTQDFRNDPTHTPQKTIQYVTHEFMHTFYFNYYLEEAGLSPEGRRVRQTTGGMSTKLHGVDSQFEKDFRESLKTDKRFKNWWDEYSYAFNENHKNNGVEIYAELATDADFSKLPDKLKPYFKDAIDLGGRVQRAAKEDFERELARKIAEPTQKEIRDRAVEGSRNRGLFMRSVTGYEGGEELAIGHILKYLSMPRHEREGLGEDLRADLDTLVKEYSNGVKASAGGDVGIRSEPSKARQMLDNFVDFVDREIHQPSVKLGKAGAHSLLALSGAEPETIAEYDKSIDFDMERDFNKAMWGAVDWLGGRAVKAGLTTTKPLVKKGVGLALKGVEAAVVANAANLIREKGVSEAFVDNPAELLMGGLVGTGRTIQVARRVISAIPEGKLAEIYGTLADETGGIRRKGDIPYDEAAEGPHTPLYKGEARASAKNRFLIEGERGEKPLIPVIKEDTPDPEIWRVISSQPKMPLKAVGGGNIVERSFKQFETPEGTKYEFTGKLPKDTPLDPKHDWVKNAQTGMEYKMRPWLENRKKELITEARSVFATGDEKAITALKKEAQSIDLEFRKRDIKGYDLPENILKKKPPVDEPGKANNVSWVENFRRNMTRPVIDTIAQMGEPGKRLAELIELTRTSSRQKAGEAIVQSQNVRAPLKKGDIKDFVAALDEGRMPRNWELEQVVLGERSILDRVADEARKVLPDFNKRQNYWPHVYKIEDIRPGGKLRSGLINDMIKSGAAENVADAQYILDSKIAASGSRYGHIDFERKTDLEGWETDPDSVLEAYYEKAFRRIEEAKQFGPKDEVAKDLIEQIRKMSGEEDAQFARNAFEQIMRRRTENVGRDKIFVPLRAFNHITLMTLSAIANSTQKMNAMLEMSKLGIAGAGRDWLKGFAVYRTKEGAEWAARSGAFIEGVTKDMEALVGATPNKRLTDTYFKIIRFKKGEALNRIFSANVGKSYADRLLNIAQGGGRRSGKAISALKEFGLDMNNLPKNWREVVAQKLTKKTQFTAEVADLPLFWSSPEGKTLVQLKNYVYNQTKFLKSAVIDEAKKGNLRPLTVFLTLFPLGGEVVADAHAAIKGKERPDNLLDRYLENMAWVGGIGILTDTYSAMQYGTSGIVGLLGGPSASLLTESVESVAEPLFEDRPPIKGARLLAGRTPFVGPLIRGRLAENRGQIDLVSPGDKAGLTNIRDYDEQRQQEIAAIKRDQAAGVDTTERAAAIGFDENAARQRYEEKRKTLNPITNAILDMSDEDPKKREVIWKRLPEEVARSYDWSSVGEQSYADEVARYKEEHDVGAYPKKERLKLDRWYRQEVAFPIIDGFTKQKDEKAAMAWQAFRATWEQKNQIMEAGQMTANSEGMKANMDAIDQYTLDLMKYSPVFANQFMAMPTTTFRR